DEGGDEPMDDDDNEEEEDPFEMLDEVDHEQLIENTAAVHATLNKIQKLSFAIIHSTTITLPAWRKTCAIHKLPICLIPRDVKTHWNSTYDMVKVALKYR
ncbi:hypothetical protein L208DRAFT_1209381, partial [Tricholoma matsutake]